MACTFHFVTLSRKFKYWILYLNNLLINCKNLFGTFPWLRTLSSSNSSIWLTEMCNGTTGLWWLAECNNMMDLYLPSTISSTSNKLKCSECIKNINKIQRRSWRNETKSSDSPLVSISIAQYDNAFYHFWLRLTPSAVWFFLYLLISSVNTTSVSEAWTDTGLSSEYYDLYLVDMICILLTAFHPMLLGQIVRYFWFPELNSQEFSWEIPPSYSHSPKLSWLGFLRF